MSRRKTHVFAMVGVTALLGLLAGGAALRAGGDEDDKIVQERKYVVRAADGEGAYLGVNIEEETDLDEGGARIVRVVEGSPAEEAGLREGDVIVGLESYTIRGPGALSRRIREMEPGSVVALKILREGESMTLTAELGERPRVRTLVWRDGEPVPLPDVDAKKWEEYARKWEEWAEQHAGKWDEWADRFAEEHDPDDLSSFYFQWSGDVGRPRLGVQLVEATPELREHLGGPAESGILVSKVLEDTPAEQAGLLVGDLIVSAGGEPVSDAADLVRAVHRAAGEVLVLEIVRDGRRSSVEAVLPEPEEDDSGPHSLLGPGVLSIPGGEAVFVPSAPDVHVLSGQLPAIPLLPAMPDVVLPEIPPDILIEIEDELIEADEVRRELERHTAEIEAARREALRGQQEAVEARRAGYEAAREALQEAAAEQEAARAVAEEERQEALERIRRELQRTLADDGLIVI